MLPKFFVLASIAFLLAFVAIAVEPTGRQDADDPRRVLCEPIDDSTNDSASGVDAEVPAAHDNPIHNGNDSVTATGAPGHALFSSLSLSREHAPQRASNDGATSSVSTALCRVCLAFMLPGERLAGLPCVTGANTSVHDIHLNCFEELVRNDRFCYERIIVINCPLCGQRVPITSSDRFEHTDPWPVPLQTNFLRHQAGVGFTRTQDIAEYFMAAPFPHDPVATLHEDIVLMRWPPYRPPVGWSDMVFWCRRAHDRRGSVNTIPDEAVGRAIVRWGRSVHIWRIEVQGGALVNFPAFPWPVGSGSFYVDVLDDVADSDWEIDFEENVGFITLFDDYEVISCQHFSFFCAKGRRSCDGSFARAIEPAIFSPDSVPPTSKMRNDLCFLPR